MEKTFAIDLDGVIHAYSKGWHDGSMYDQPNAGAHDALASLVAQGIKISIVTARLHPKHGDEATQRANILKWLADNGFEEGKHYHELTNNKPSAIAYVDDRAIKFKDWNQTAAELRNLINE